jgi:hypothetical protein
VNLHDTPAWGLKRVFSPGAQYCPDLEAGAALGLVWHPQIANSETETFRLAYAQTCVRGQSSGPWNRRPARLSPGESRPIDRALTTIPAAGFRRARKSPWPMASRTRRPKLRGSRRLVLPDQSAQFPQEQHRLTAPWRLLLAGRCGTEAGVRLGRRRLLSGKAWQAGASREVNVPVEEKVPLVVLLVRVAPLSSWLTGLRQRPAARGAAASFPGLPPPYRDGETAAIGARGF